MRFLKIILTISIVLATFLGDYLVFSSKYSSSELFRAVSDSLVHCTVGFLSAILFFTYDVSISQYASISCIMFCAFLSSAIDIDHAIAARSIYLKDMLNLNQRGFLHCTSIWLAVSTVLLMYSYVAKKLNICILSFMIIIAYSSHHIRDGNRRGLWLCPLGSTPPINKHLYMFLLGFLPNLYGCCYKYLETRVFKDSIVNIDYKMLV